jgi:hypothetical protein
MHGELADYTGGVKQANFSVSQRPAYVVGPSA